MGYEITDSLSEPYSQATAALPSYFPPSSVGIAGVPYLLDTASDLYRRVGFDVVQQRNTTDARDVLLLPQDVWRQQAQSWHLVLVSRTWIGMMLPRIAITHRMGLIRGLSGGCRC